MESLSSQQNRPSNKVQNTVFLARQKREKQGPWEAEVSYGGEADLHQHLNLCDKNPGHQKFLPVDQFNVDHLPPGCRDNDLVDYVRAVSDLTVRVSVNYVSEKRPETVPESGKPYPSYKDWGSNMLRTGTGSVWKVDKYPNKWGSSRTCKCQECMNSSTPKTQFAEIHIQTAAHVVYDNLEGAHTTCHLFFDKGGSPTHCSCVRALTGWSFVRGWRGFGDWCELRHMTHDICLADRLHQMVDCWYNIWEKVNSKYRRLKSGEQESSSPSEYLAEVWDKLTIIVSHPHGCSKQISLGYCTDRDEEEGRPIEFRYTAATCPGSSGANVFVMGEDNMFRFWAINNLHCGNCEDNKKLNFSNFAW